MHQRSKNLITRLEPCRILCWQILSSAKTDLQKTPMRITKRMEGDCKDGTSLHHPTPSGYRLAHQRIRSPFGIYGDTTPELQPLYQMVGKGLYFCTLLNQRQHIQAPRDEERRFKACCEGALRRLTPSWTFIMNCSQSPRPWAEMESFWTSRSVENICRNIAQN